MKKTFGKIKDVVGDYILYTFFQSFNRKVRTQRKFPLTIPVLIVNYNQLANLKNLISFLFERKFQNIVIVDNKSTYPPLLEYYKSLNGRVTVEYMPDNYGHMVFFENKQLQEKYGQGYYILTDPDILPNPNLPENFMSVMLKIMDRYHFHIQKVGFALDIESIPDYFPLKQKVLSWERQYWTKEIAKDVYHADIDTTFALYKPRYPAAFNSKRRRFYEALRLGGSFTIKHMGWYLNPENLSNEQRYYR